jgi:hypothetical protein
MTSKNIVFLKSTNLFAMSPPILLHNNARNGQDVRSLRLGQESSHFLLGAAASKLVVSKLWFSFFVEDEVN